MDKLTPEELIKLNKDCPFHQRNLQDAYSDGLSVGAEAQLAKRNKGRDKPDREKIIARRFFYFVINHISPSNLIGWEWEKVQWYCQNEAKQILLLLPDIEEAKREEREKVIVEFDNMFHLAPEDDSYLRVLVKLLYEALKAGKWAKAELGQALKKPEEGHDG